MIQEAVNALLKVKDYQKDSRKFYQSKILSKVPTRFKPLWLSLL